MKKHLTYCLLLCAITVFVWNKILSQPLMGEGFYYFGERFFASIDLGKPLFPDMLVRYDKGPRLLFELFVRTFKDTIVLYQLFALISVAGIGVLFYQFVFTLLRRKEFAFICACIFIASYAAFFEMIGIGNYQFFAQRAFPFLFLFPSATFCMDFFQTKKKKYFSYTCILYALATYYSQFSIFFLPFYFAYFLSYSLVQKPRKKDFAILFICPGVMMIISYIFLLLDMHFGRGSFLKGQNFFFFLIKENRVILFHLFRQLIIITFSDRLLKVLLDIFNLNLEKVIPYAAIVTVIIYLFASFFIWIKEKKLRIPLLTSFFFFPCVFVLNMFMRGEEVMRLGYGSRYLFVPMIGFSIFLTLFLAAISKNMKSKIFPFFLVFLWIAVNTKLIWSDIAKDQYRYDATYISLHAVKRIASTFQNDSLVIVPSPLGYHGARFSKVFYGKKETQFWPFFADWSHQLPRAFNPAKVVILVYNEKKRTVENRTKNYKELIESLDK